MRDEDLKHYGVKGMKWGVTRSQAEIDAAEGGGGGGGEDEDDILDELGDLIDSAKKKMSEIGDDLKKAGYNFLVNVVGLKPNKGPRFSTDIKPGDKVAGYRYVKKDPSTPLKPGDKVAGYKYDKPFAKKDPTTPLKKGDKVVGYKYDKPFEGMGTVGGQPIGEKLDKRQFRR